MGAGDLPGLAPPPLADPGPPLKRDNGRPGRGESALCERRGDSLPAWLHPTEAPMSSPARTRSWNAAMGASPGDIDLTIPPGHIEGALPKRLRGGRMLSNGPGWTRIGDRTAHPFDGHGYVRSFAIQADGSVHLRARFVHTPSYTAERDAQKLVHRGFATNVTDRFWDNLGFGPPRNVANTTITRWGDRLLAGWEAGAPHALDPTTLDTRGEDHFGGILEGKSTLAHMRKDAIADRLVLCTLAQARQATFTFHEVDPTGTVVSTATAQIDGMVFAHDYALSPSWFVLGGNPLRMKPWQLVRTLLGTGTLLTSVATDLRKPGMLHLVPRGGGDLRSVELPGKLFVVHFGNAFEQDDGTLIVDACAFADFPFGEEFGYTGPQGAFDPGLPEARGPQKLVRITVPAGATTATWERLTEHGVDFPRFHPDHEGRETPLLFGATRKDTRYSDPFDSVIGIDLLDRDRPEDLWTAPDTVFVGEPIFVPDPENGDQGTVLVILSDGASARTTLAVFDARRLSAGPVATVPLPLLPIAFHGDWDPEGAS